MTSPIPTPYASLRKQKRMDLAAAIPLPGPLALYVEPTNICNFNCRFCPESFENYKEISGGAFRLSLSDFELISEQVAEFGKIKTLNFYMMGEPFVNRHLTQFVAIAKKKSLAEKIIVTSNGSLVRPDIYEDLLNSGLDYLRISIYGGNEDSHRANTKSRVALSRIKQNISGLKAMRDSAGLHLPFIYIKMIDSRSSSENEQFHEFFREAGDEIAIEAAMNWNDPEEGDLSGLTTTELLRQASFAGRKEKCPFPFYTVVVHADLSVSVCCVDWNKKTVVGNLKEQSLKEIWSGDALRAFRTTHLKGRRKDLDSCRNCTYLHTAPDDIDALTEAAYLDRLAGRPEV